MAFSHISMDVDYALMPGCACAMCGSAPQADPTPVQQTATATNQAYDSSRSDADQGVDALLSGSKWATTSLTYSFPDSASDFTYDFYGEAKSDFAQMNAAQIAAVRIALDYYASVSQLEFTELSAAADRDADLTFAESSAPGTAWAYYPSSGDWGGDSWFNRNNFNSPETGNYAWSTVMHEIGHALGLKHGHETNGPGAIPSAEDSHEYSIMTYRSYVGSPGTSYTNGVWSGPQTPMIYDIAAIQEMYGANFTTNSGDTNYRFAGSSGQMFVDGVGAVEPGGNYIFRALWDGGGEDTYDFSNYGRALEVDLAPGGFVDLDANGNAQRAYLGGGVYAKGHLFNALQYEGDARSLIENAIGGSAGDVIRGNQADNRLEGRGGADTLQGFAGDDTLIGGAGGDTFVYDWREADHYDQDVLADLDFSEGDRLTLEGFGSNFFIGSDISVGFGEPVVIDSLADLSALADALGVTVSGGASGASVYSFIYSGWTGSLVIGGSAGFVVGGSLERGGPNADSIAGGAGNDTLLGSAGNDSLDGAGGGDRVEGGDGDDSLLGGVGGDLISGNNHRDTIRGGDGDDSLYGGWQNDFIVGDGGDDWVRGGQNDDLIGGGAGDDSLFGDDGNDRIDGGSGDDRIEGGAGDDSLLGSAGADDMSGDAGRDTLRGGAGDDSIDGGEGADFLIGDGGADEIRGGADRDVINGGAEGDALFGDAGDDLIDGSTGDDRVEGGAGADDLRGSAGADTLLGGDGGDSILGGDGDDVIGGNNQADTIRGGDGNDALYGGWQNDFIVGDAGDDWLRGGQNDDVINGGAGDDTVFGDDGNDVMAGSSGADQFVFSDGFGVDRIADFEVGRAGEAIDLGGVTAIADFTDLTADHLFQVGGNAEIRDGADRIVLSGVQVDDLTEGDFLF